MVSEDFGSWIYNLKIKLCICREPERELLPPNRTMLYECSWAEHLQSRRDKFSPDIVGEIAATYPVQIRSSDHGLDHQIGSSGYSTKMQKDFKVVDLDRTTLKAKHMPSTPQLKIARHLHKRKHVWLLSIYDCQ